MRLYAGIDLHSSNNYLGIIDDQDQRLLGRRIPNNIEAIKLALSPFRDHIAGIAVESTYNWYWLVDGLQDAGYTMHLANPSAIKQYEGLKYTDDKWDSFLLAHMLRLGILPQGYIYPKDKRPVRDLMRKRMAFVQKRTSHILSLQSLISRHLAAQLPVREIKKMTDKDVDILFKDQFTALSVSNHIESIKFLDTKIKKMEKIILKTSKLEDYFQILTTMPGIGDVLGLTIMLEVGDINRFASPGNYASYCRCVKSVKISNGKRKGQGNRKNGNKYLAWAYVEAAHLIIRFCPEANKFYQRKRANNNCAVATKALANKLARATYCMMRDQTEFDKAKLFG